MYTVCPFKGFTLPYSFVSSMHTYVMFLGWSYQVTLRHLEGEKTGIGREGESEKCNITAYYKYIVNRMLSSSCHNLCDTTHRK